LRDGDEDSGIATIHHGGCALLARDDAAKPGFSSVGEPPSHMIPASHTVDGVHATQKSASAMSVFNFQSWSAGATGCRLGRCIIRLLMGCIAGTAEAASGTTTGAAPEASSQLE